MPEIRSSSEIYGQIRRPRVLLVALSLWPVFWVTNRLLPLVKPAFDPGEAKNTYGTGCFMILNTGSTNRFFPSRFVDHARLQIWG